MTDPQPSPSPADFVTAIFGDSLDEARRAVVWAKGRGSVWCSTPGEVAGAVAASATSLDVYLGACLQDAHAERPHSRGRAASAAVLGAVWVDVDVEAGIHSASGYPPDVDRALAHLATRVPHAPSVVLATGGGVHLWWILDEPFVINDEDDRAEAASLVGRFQAMIRAVFGEQGWKLDATHDLARVMRLPGTSNHKSSPPRPVRCLTWEPHRVYAPSHLLEGCPQWAPEAREPAAIDDDLAVFASGNPPADKLTTLMEIDPAFKRTWLRKRSDLADQSQSGYDFALMGRALRAGWSDQEAIDLAVAHRRAGGKPPKRASYYIGTATTEGTLGRLKAMIATEAREQARTEREEQAKAQQTAATERLLDVSVGAGAGDGVPGGGLEPSSVLADLRAALGLPVVGVRKHVIDPPWWEMLLDGPVATVPLGTIEWALRYGTFRQRVAAATDIIPAAMKNEKWTPIAQLLLDLAEDVSYGDLTEAGGLVLALVRDYLASYQPTEDRQLAAARGYPVIHGGHLGLTLSGLRTWLAVAERDRMSKTELARLLKNAGFEMRPLNHEIDLGHGESRKTSRGYWWAPKPWPWPVAGQGVPRASDSAVR